MSTPMQASLQQLRATTVIAVQFPNTADLNRRFRQLPGARWSQTLNSWTLPDTVEYRRRFGLEAKPPVGKEVLAQIALANQPALQRMEQQLILKNYSASTRKTYLVEFAQLLYVLKNTPAESLSYDRLRAYFAWCLGEKKMSANHVHSRMNAIKFYYEQVLQRENFSYEIPRPKKPLLLPKVISESAVSKLLAAATYPKHRMLLSLCYGMGLRVSEICALKITDIDSDRMQMLIKAAKGKKNRYVNLPQCILDDLRQYYKASKPKHYLFEGQYGGPYSKRSAQKVFKYCLHKAGINKKVGIHSLRHSFATHLLEQGTDISLIQKLLGHNDIKTTLRYLHITNKDTGRVISPLDKLAGATNNKKVE